jgi:zinc protease
MNIEQITLKNGLNTLLIESPHSNVTTAQIWFKAGSSLESKEDQGIAHFLEHMFFKGTKKYPDIMLAKTVESYGGEVNAFTSFDYTCYYINGPANETLTTVDVLMDMVSNPLFLEEDLGPEKGVVFEEFRRSIDNPSQLNFFNIQKAAFPKAYARAILGTEKTIKSFTRQQLIEFRKKYYNLENALLIIAGNIPNKNQLTKKIESFALPHGDYSNFAKFKLKTKPTFNIHEKAVNQSTLTFTIQAPDYIDNNSPAEDLALNCLAYGDISPLYKKLVVENSIASSIGGSTMFFSKGGCHLLRFAFPTENFDQLVTELPIILRDILKTGFSQDDVDRIRNQYIASKIYEKESIESFAFSLGHGFAQNGNIHCEDIFINQMKNVSKAEITKTLTDILNRNFHITVQNPLQTDHKKATEKLELLSKNIKTLVLNENKKTHNYKVTTSHFDSETQCIDLKKGIKLLYRRNQQTPTFVLHAYLKGGLSYENETNGGVYNLIASNITYGYGTKKYDNLKNELERKSSYINGFSGRNAYGITLHGLSEHSDSLFQHFMSLFIKPSFPNNLLQTEKELLKRTIHIRKEDPVKKCFEEFSKLVFNEHPYARQVIGSEKSLKKITRKTLIETHANSLANNEMVITYCGDLDLDSVLEKIKPHLDSLTTRGTVKKSQLKNKIKPIKNKHLNFNFDREQTHIMIGKASYKVAKKEDLYLKVLTTFLSGQSSELFVEVRDKQGLCYSVQVLQNTSLEAGFWGVYIGTGNEKVEQAIMAIKEILNKYQKNGFTKKDFDLTKKMIKGQNLISVQTNDDYASFYSIGVLHSLGLDYQHLSYQEIDNMKLTDFNVFLQQFLKNDWNIVKVGKESLS